MSIPDLTKCFGMFKYLMSARIGHNNIRLQYVLRIILTPIPKHKRLCITSYYGHIYQNIDSAVQI